MARIAVDAMGGDFGPGPIVAGSVRAARDLPGITSIILVGDETAVQAELSRYGEISSLVSVRHASEVVGMDESPANAVRRKKDSSIGRAVDLVKAGEADVIFSAGSTGAAVAATTLKLRTLAGVSRPAIAAVFPTPTKPFVLLDVGANTDCTARMLVDFAVMGAVYSREILRVPAPRIGLLSIGEEDAKGNEVTKEAFRMLHASELNFTGNVESGDLFDAKVDVAVCDGFVGNVVLKTSESTARALGSWVRQEIISGLASRIGAVLCRGAFARIRAKSDPSQYGGAPLLGVNGVCIIGHGSSNETAVFNAIRVAERGVEHHINPQIVETIANIRKIQEAPTA